MKLFGEVYRARRVLVTGHTGFKGSWLSLWLQEMGADVSGIALSPESHPNHWSLLKLDTKDLRMDIRDASSVQKAIREINPEIIFHLAAQPLVRRSYHDPVETWSTNVMGTANLLEACRNEPDVRAIVCITTDKCYENQEWVWGYREIDRLGGHDPYSASKAATELVAASYRSAFFNLETTPLLGTARAGNVIGGGDWSEDRLIPDLIRAAQKNHPLVVRSPNATRPWQHVLESLSGYLLLGQKLFLGERPFADAWNFGPDTEGNRTVAEILGKCSSRWERVRWQVTEIPQLHEANLLHLDSTKARQAMHWHPVWGLDTCLSRTIDWYRSWLDKREVISREQLHDYISDAVVSDNEWAE